MSTKIIITVLILALSALSLQAQVAINTDNSTANSSAMLDVKSTSKGVLVPRMSTAQRTAISSPANGLMVYDETTNSFWFYDSGNSGWSELVITEGATELNDLSDAIYDGSSVFIGHGSGISDNGNSYNVGVGRLALYNNTDGYYNVGIGDQAVGRNSTGDYNTGIGYGSLFWNETGNFNTAIGNFAGIGTSGVSFSACVFLGNEAGRNNTSSNKLYIDNSNTSSPLIGGDFSTNQVDINGTIKITGGSPGVDKVLTSDASGLASWSTLTGAIELNDLTDAYTNVGSVFLGHNAGNNDDGSNNNTAVGYQAMLNNTSGRLNTANGYYSLFSNTSGTQNVGLGYSANGYNQTGNNNTAVGSFAGQGSPGVSFSGCVFLGNEAGKNNTSNNRLYIDNSSAAYPLIGGDFSTNQVDINGTIKITGGSPGVDKVLTSDADGLASWETIASSALNDLSDAYTDGSNIFVGAQVGTNDNGGNYNTVFGDEAFKTNVSGQHNTGFGYKALELSTGESNTAFGLSSLRKNSSGSNNVSVGFETMYNNQTGSSNTAIGYQSGASTIGSSFSGCVFIGNQAGKSNTSSNKLFISNTDDTTPLIGGDFSSNQLYFNTTEVGIGTDSPNEELEVAGVSGNSARMIVSDGMGSNRNVILFVSPNSSDNYARLEAYKYGTATGGRTLKINTSGNGNIVMGGNVIPETHKGKDLGANGTAWDDVYADDFVNQGAAAFANISVTTQLLLFPPQEKKAGAFDEFTDKGAKELDPASLPASLTQEDGLLIDEMTTYNYKANYEQQQQIETLKAENISLKARLERLEVALLQSGN